MSSQKPRFIRFNILFVYLLILLTGGWLSYSVYQTGISIKSVNQALTDRQLPSLNQISALSHWLNDYERILYEFYATVEREDIYPKLKYADEKILENVQALTKSYPDHVDIIQVVSIYQKMKTHAKILDEVLPPEPSDWDEAREELVRISLLGQATLPYLDSLTDQIKSEIERSELNSNHQLSQMSMWVFVFASVILLIALLVGYYIRKSMQQAQEKNRLALFVENNPNPVACIGFDGRVEFENTAWHDIYGKDQNSLIMERINDKLNELEKQDADFIVTELQDAKSFLELSIHKIADFNQFMVYVENITEREVARRELEFFAYHDPLTGLPNLKKLETDLQVLIERGREQSFCLLSIGIKRLQLITTTHGHSVTDALIKAVVMRLQNALSSLMPEYEICRVYRFTGAKFDVLLGGAKSGATLSDAVFSLDSNLQDAFQKSLNTSFGQFYLDVEAGCAFFPDHGESPAVLIKNTSAALNDAHKNGFEGVNVFNHELAYREQNWFRLENDMRQSRFDESFFLTYQPKVNLIDSRLIGMEALVRWEHPEKGLVSPVEFIPIAEESGMILELGDWILNEAIRQTSEWIDCGATELQVAVNVSPSQLLSANFVERVIGALETHHLSPRHLEIEITEEVMVEDKTLCIRILQALKKAGVSIAIDDFGTGYSSLAYLNRFPVSKLKIDRSFVTDIHDNEGNFAIVRTIIALSKSLDFTVIAEGIEYEQEFEILKQLGCHQGQGYLFSKPLTSNEFTRQYIMPNLSNNNEHTIDSINQVQ